jgi:hypothetical protein
LFRPVSILSVSEVVKIVGGSKNWNQQLQSEKLLTAWMAGQERFGRRDNLAIHAKRLHRGWASPSNKRAGCPGSDVLRKIASHEMPLPEAEKWLDHLTSCSPRYGDFSQFQAASADARKGGYVDSLGETLC